MSLNRNGGRPLFSSLSPSLRWTLGLSVLASAGSLLLPSNAPEAPTTSPVPPQLANTGPVPSAKLPSKQLQAFTPEMLEAPTGDPFALPPPPPAPAPVAAPSPPPAPAPSAPPLNYRYLGRFTDPQGHPKVYIANGTKDMLIEVGTQLDEGYRVEAITEDEIRLIYPPLQQRASIPIVPAKP